MVLDRTPFYAEAGGQVGDRGEIVGSGGTFEVADTQKIQADVYGHQGTLKTGVLKLGDEVEARVDTALRARTMRNHSVTHLMHKALREVLGSHVQQKGSLVDADKTRFDFSHDKPVTDEELREVERRVNAEILLNTPTRAQVMPIDEAKNSGAVMLFGEKYGDEVRVLDIGTSREFCGGTHVARTGDIGLFRIYSEGGVAAGIRRIEATTGSTALAMMDKQLRELSQVARQLRTQPGSVEKAVATLVEEKKLWKKSWQAALQARAWPGAGPRVAGRRRERRQGFGRYAGRRRREDAARYDGQAEGSAEIGGHRARRGAGRQGLAHRRGHRRPDGEAQGRRAVNFVAQQVGGKGGGRPDMAQAGGTEPAKLPVALQSVKSWVEQRV